MRKWTPGLAFIIVLTVSNMALACDLCAIYRGEQAKFGITRHSKVRIEINLLIGRHYSILS